MMVLEVNVVTGEVVSRSMTPEDISQLPPAQTNAEKLSAELKALSDAHQTDLTQFRLLWTSISITDGVNEETRKANLRVQWTARTNQYSADVAAAKLKYQ